MSSSIRSVFLISGLFISSSFAYEAAPVRVATSTNEEGTISSLREYAFKSNGTINLNLKTEGNVTIRGHHQESFIIYEEIRTQGAQEAPFTTRNYVLMLQRRINNKPQTALRTVDQISFSCNGTSNASCSIVPTENPDPRERTYTLYVPYSTRIVCESENSIEIEHIKNSVYVQGHSIIRLANIEGENITVVTLGDHSSFLVEHIAGPIHAYTDRSYAQMNCPQLIVRPAAERPEKHIN